MGFPKVPSLAHSLGTPLLACFSDARRTLHSCSSAYRDTCRQPLAVTILQAPSPMGPASASLFVPCSYPFKGPSSSFFWSLEAPYQPNIFEVQSWGAGLSQASFQLCLFQFSFPPLRTLCPKYLPTLLRKQVPSPADPLYRVPRFREDRSSSCLQREDPVVL